MSSQDTKELLGNNEVLSSSAKPKGETIKKRNWIGIVYPESLPSDWIDILKKTGLQIAVSPLHDKDVYTKKDEEKNPAHKAGTPKKPHYHVILVYNGPTSFKVVTALIREKLNGLYPESVASIRAYYRYLTHKDDPDKYQYDENEIQHLNGFNVLDFSELSKSEVSAIENSLIRLICQKKFREYSDFVIYCLDNLSESEADIAKHHTFFFDKFITSRRNKEKEQRAKTTYPPQTAADVATLGEEALGDNDTIKEE